MQKQQRFDLADVIEQEIDDALNNCAEMGEPIELDDDQRSRIVLVIDKHLSEELHQQVLNALF